MKWITLKLIDAALFCTCCVMLPLSWLHAKLSSPNDQVEQPPGSGTPPTQKPN